VIAMSFFGKRPHVQSQYPVYRESRPDSPSAVPCNDPKRPGDGRKNTPAGWTRRPYGKAPNR
jgi:hypothetical protein